MKKPSASFTEELDFEAALRRVIVEALPKDQGAIVADRLCVFFGLDRTKLFASEVQAEVAP